MLLDEVHSSSLPCRTSHPVRERFVPITTRNMWSLCLLASAALLSSGSAQYLPVNYQFSNGPYHVPVPAPFDQQYDNYFPRARNLHESDFNPRPILNPYLDIPYYFLVPRIAQQENRITSRNSVPVSAGGKDTADNVRESLKPETFYVPAPTNGQFGGPLYVTSAATNNAIDENVEIVPLLIHQQRFNSPEDAPNPQWFHKRSYDRLFSDFDPEYYY